MSSGDGIDLDRPLGPAVDIERLALRAGATVDGVWCAAVALLLARRAATDRVALGWGEGPSPRTVSIDVAREIPFATLAAAAGRLIARPPDDPAAAAGLSSVLVRPTAIAATPEPPSAQMALGLARRSGGWVVCCRCPPETTDAELVVEQLCAVLREACAAPETAVGRLPTADARERRLVERWNATGRPYDPADGLVSLFERQVRGRPDAVAVTDGGGSLTYSALARRADRLARALLAAGAKPERPVAVSMPRSMELVIALLAVLKAGAPYVGIEPGVPTTRKRFVVEDLGVELAVAAGDSAAELRAAGVAVVAPTRDCDERGPFAPRASHPAGFAYAIYTSGSTGTPKAVLIEHGSAVSFVHWARAAFADQELQGALATTSPSLDCTLFELFSPLCWGGRVVLMDSTLDLASAPHRNAVALVSTVPRVMSELLEARALPPSVRTVNLAGDALGSAVLAALAATPTVARVCNHYGPSETTTYSTGTSLFERDDALSLPAPLVAADDQPPIGGPIANTRVDVLDEQLAPLPIGVVGEICIAGDGVARGYAGRPALTAERFVPDCTGGRAGARMYRTGDLARWRPDGQLEFLGRIDRQLKVRGFRVEPEEIEAVLSADPSVSLAVVALRDLPGRGPSLVAWYSGGADVPEHEQSDALRAACRAALPEHMVPAAFVRLGRLPRTAMGKIDARRLPDPPAKRSALRARRTPDPGLDLLPPSAR